MTARRLPLIGWLLLIGVVVSGCSGAGWSSDGESEVTEIVESFPAPEDYDGSAIDFKGCSSTGWLDSCGGRRANVDFIYDGGASPPTLSELCSTVEASLAGWGAGDFEPGGGVEGQCIWSADSGDYSIEVVVSTLRSPTPMIILRFVDPD